MMLPVNRFGFVRLACDNAAPYQEERNDQKNCAAGNADMPGGEQCWTEDVESGFSGSRRSGPPAEGMGWLVLARYLRPEAVLRAGTACVLRHRAPEVWKLGRV